MLVWAGSLPVAVAAPVPYTPSSPDTVLLRRVANPLQAASQLSADAVRLRVQALIQSGRASGDPRDFGRARALLAPWWQQPKPPTDLWVLRAVLKQQTHDFSGAMADLDALLIQHPQHAQAHLTRASVRLLRGDTLGAQQDCAALIGKTSALTAITCVASVSAMNGKTPTAISALSQALQNAQASLAAERLWSQTVLGELWFSQQNHAEAEQVFTQALANARTSGINSPYLKAAVADLWLAMNKPQAVLTLLINEQANDNLLLRIALAQQQAGQTAALAESVAELKQRFALAAARGEDFHTREQAAFTLWLLQQPEAALRLAQANWQVQHESIDAQLLLQAAVAAQQPAAAQPVLQWLREHHSDDQRVLALVKKIPVLKQ